MAIIFHIARKEEWGNSSALYRPEMFSIDGFVHCSTREQVVKVANTRFRGQPGLVLLCIDTGKITSEIRYENLEGGRELFDCAAQGRIDAFFLGGAQIDGAANINLVGIGGYPQSDVRLAGSFGSSYLYFLVPRVILFKPEHTRRTLVERVDFVSAPGTSPRGTYRPGGPVALLTGRCVFAFDRDAARFRLAARHPDQTLEEISSNTAFEFGTPEHVPLTREPDEETLAVIRGEVCQDLAGTYPRFAEQVLAQQFR